LAIETKKEWMARNTKIHKGLVIEIIKIIKTKVLINKIIEIEKKMEALIW